VIDDTSKAISGDEEELPGLFLQIIQRDDLNQHQRDALPLESGIVAE
jgi:hypothetical protein